MGKKPIEELRRMKGGGAGMRRLLLDDLREERADCPRPLARGVEQYASGMDARPLFGLHKVARLSEHYLYRARFGKLTNRRYEADADRIFFDIRQAIATLVHNWNGKSDLSRAQRERLRAAVRRYGKDLKSLGEAFDRVGRVRCPCCGGSGRIFDLTDAPSAVKAVLDDAVRDGRLGYSEANGYFGV